MDLTNFKPDGQNSIPIAQLAHRFLRELKRLWFVPVLTIGVFVLVAKFLVPARALTSISFQSQMWAGGKIRLAENGVYQEEPQDYFATQMELMQSRVIQRRAYEHARKEKPDSVDNTTKLTVALSPHAALFTLTATGTNGDFLQVFLNAVMDEFLQYKREVRQQSADLTLVSISEQLSKMDAEADTAQAQLTAFLRSNSVAGLQEQGAGASSYVSELNRKFADLTMQSQLLELFSKQDLADSPSLDNSSDKRPEDLQREAMRDLNRLKSQRAELAVNLRPAHPTMIKLDNEIREQEQTIEFARQQGREVLKQRQVALRLEMKNLESAIRDWEARALTASRLMAEYDRLNQNVARADRLHDYLLSMVRSVDINRNLEQEVIAILQRAEPITTAAKAQAPKEALAAVAGLFGGLGVLCLIALTSDKVGTAAELKDRLKVPVIGQIPEVTTGKANSGPFLLVSKEGHHGFSESVNSIRSSLFYTTVGNNRPKSILVTSALSGEGKSTVALNLAQAFAMAGYRVLLVDGDLRRSALPGILGLPAQPGLTEVLRDETGIEETVVRTSIPNLSFIPAGRSVNNPGELFLSGAADRFLAAVYCQYDYVVIDSVPVLAADDTASLAPKVEGILFVVRGFSTSTRLATHALELLHNRQGCVVGAVCNRGASDLPEYNYQKIYSGNKHA